MKNITVSSCKTKGPSVASDRYMLKHGFRRSTKAEQKKFRRLVEKIFVEKDPKGYVIRRAGFEKSIAFSGTQAGAIEKARALNPDAPIHVERVRHSGGARQIWRRV